MTPSAPRVRTHFRNQARACRRLGSPFTAQLLDLAAERLGPKTRVGQTILDWSGDPGADALALRLAGGLHALVLSGGAGPLAAVFPGGANAQNTARLWPAVARALVRHEAALLDALTRAPQTNEVARAAVLLGGFLTVAAETGRPLVLLEIGASAGLNLHWDAYRYDLGGAVWGPEAAPIVLAPTWRGNLPPLVSVAVGTRAGCDRHPIDVTRAVERLRLRAYVWADQADRLRRLDAALAHAATRGLRLEQADAGDWLGRHLERPEGGCTTVLFHSIVWQYLAPATQARCAATIEAAAARATIEAPFAWLRMEPAPGGGHTDLRLTLWPGGHERRLARADFHGRWIEWAAG